MNYWNEMTGKKKLLWAIAMGAVVGAVNSVLNAVKAKREREQAQYDLEVMLEAQRLAEKAKMEQRKKTEEEFNNFVEEYKRKRKEEVDELKKELERLRFKADVLTNKENGG